MTLAYQLSDTQHEITLFEKSGQLGGLATFHDYGEFIWDKYYHVILPQDKYLIGYINEIGLKDKLNWKRTYTGFYFQKKIYSLSNAKEFLVFPGLNPIHKIRLAFTILLASLIRNWQKLDEITSEEWLIRFSGTGTYERFWKPLLMAKLGEEYNRVSAIFIWTYIKRLFGARSDLDQKEKMGYVSGGYHTIIKRTESELLKNRVTIIKSIEIERIRKGENTGIAVEYKGGTDFFDKLIYTGPNSILEKIAAPDMYNNNVYTKNIEYLGVICLVLITRKEISPYYILNIADKTIPFTGVIGLSSIVDISETGGYYVTYFPKYIISDSIVFDADDKELQTDFISGIKSMFPEFDEKDIISAHIHKTRIVQPLQVTGYLKMIGTGEIKTDDFFVLNTTQFVTDTLNNNSVVKLVNEFITSDKYKIMFK